MILATEAGITMRCLGKRHSKQELIQRTQPLTLHGLKRSWMPLRQQVELIGLSHQIVDDLRKPEETR